MSEGNDQGAILNQILQHDEETEETIEQPFIEEDNVDIDFTEEVEVEEVDLSFVNMPVDKNDMFVIVFLQNDQYLDITTKVKDIIANQITFSSETPIQAIKYEDGNVILRSDDYEIVSLDKVEEFDLETLSKDDVLIEDISVELDITITKQKEYSPQEKKEDMITELINSLKAHGNDSRIHQISEMIQDIVILISQDRYEDSSNTLSFIKEIIHNNNYKLPPWILPIVANKKRLFKDEEEGESLDETEDTFVRNYETFLQERYDQNNPEGEYNQQTYQSSMRTLSRYKAFKVKSLRRASSAISFVKATTARRPSVSTSLLSVVISTVCPLLPKAVTVPWSIPVGIVLIPLDCKRFVTSSGR